MAMHVLVINPDGGTLAMMNVPSPPPLEFLQTAVKGPIQQTPMFDHFALADGKLSPCVVFCNEEGKLNGMEVNMIATMAWGETLLRDHSLEPFDVLVGPVVLILADTHAELEGL